MRKIFGIELMLDMHKCDISTFSKENLNRYFVELCDLIAMKRHGEPMYWHDDSDIPHLKGVSAIQFIETSNVVVHALEILEAVYVNIFSCKKFDIKIAQEFTKNFFKAQEVDVRIIERK